MIEYQAGDPLPSEPGIYLGVPMSVYREIRAANGSSLKVMHAKSALHYDHEQQPGNQREADFFAKGGATHTLTLEPEKFGAEFAVWDYISPNTGKLAVRNGKVWDAFREESHADGKVTIAQKDYEVSQSIAGAVRDNEFAAACLVSGNAEVTIIWNDEVTGILCKGRPDWITTANPAIRSAVKRALGIDLPPDAPGLVGLKTTHDPHPDAFSRQASRLCYALSWALYSSGYHTITSVNPWVVEIVAESAAPFDVTPKFIPDEVLYQGELDYSTALRKLSDCYLSGDWPGHSPAVAPFVLQSWAITEPDLLEAT